jgi:hypothetical protein|nr:MAG TPA: hypothetical protein [Caudoviricetes sp.]
MEHNLYMAISHMQRIGKKPVLAIMSADGKMERVILLDYFNGKTRDFYQNEAIGSDITDIILKANLSNYSEGTIRGWVKERDSVSISFGHENFVIYKSVLKPHEIEE